MKSFVRTLQSYFLFFIPAVVLASSPAEETWQSLASAYVNACTGFQVHVISWHDPFSCAKWQTRSSLERQIAEALKVNRGVISWGEITRDLSYLHVDDSAQCAYYKKHFESEFLMNGLTGIAPNGHAVSVNYWALQNGGSAPGRCMQLILSY